MIPLHHDTQLFDLLDGASQVSKSRPLMLVQIPRLLGKERIHPAIHAGGNAGQFKPRFILKTDHLADHPQQLAHLGMIRIQRHGPLANLGTGQGSSVLEVISAAAKAVGREVPYEVVDRRPGDVSSCYADPTLAAEKLGWKAERDLDAMCADHWRWQEANPQGYA